jgi:hypothetical protein
MFENKSLDFRLPVIIHNSLANLNSLLFGIPNRAKVLLFFKKNLSRDRKSLLRLNDQRRCGSLSD